MTEQEYLKLFEINPKDPKIKEYNKALISKYPWLSINRDYNWDSNTYSGPNEKEDYTYTWLDDMPYGWRLAFGLQMCEEIQNELVKHNCVNQYSICQIKEKYSGLRWYDGGAPKEVHDIINKYEELSYITCINCGKSAKWLSKGWICPYCDDCKNIFKDTIYTPIK